MTFFSSAARAIVLAFCLPVMGGLLGALLGLSLPAALFPLIGGAVLGAWLSLRASTNHVPAPSPAPALPRDPDPKLRHDIRGIVSPAMLAAEQLSLSPDPQVSKAGTTINDCLDRLTARLKQQPPRAD
ncbi:MAG: hypothetical protein ABF946_04195 [Acetobacter papayae]